MKNRSCPNKVMCFDYDASNCEDCAVGTLINKQKAKIRRLKAENDSLRERLEKAEKEKLPCHIGDILYNVSAYFSRGCDTDGNTIHESGWKIFTVKVDEMNLYRMYDRVSKGEAFFTKEAAEIRLAELKGEKQ